MKKIFIKYALIAIALITLFTIWGFSIRYKMNQICKEVRVDIRNEGDDYFIGIEQLRNHLQEILYNETVDSRILPKRMGEINLNMVELILEENPFIKNAEVYRRNGGILEVRVHLNKAIARFRNVRGEQFYLDESGVFMPLTETYTPNVIIVSGFVTESIKAGDSLRSESGKRLYPMLQYIHNNPFFRAQISEIVVSQNGDLTLLPEVGSIYVEFGTADDYQEKLDNLMLFYRQVLNRTGWDRYKKVSVKFRGQIVATRINPYDPDISEFN
jgi:cell division protein FtsQ